MGAGWVEVCRAIYSFGLLLLGGAVLFALPSALRVVRDLAAALGAFTTALSKTTVAAETQREQLALTKAIAAHLGVKADP